MRIVHVITRLIIGGAQENTLLTVDGLHHHYHDDVTLITGPAEGPEGDLFERARQRELKVELMPELVRAIRPRTDLKAYGRLARQSAGSSPTSFTLIARRRASWAGRPPGRNGCPPSSIQSMACPSALLRAR